MRLFAEVFTPAGVQVGIVNLISCGVMDKLDELGTFKLAVASTDNDAVTHLQSHREVRVYGVGKQKRLLAQGILLKKSLSIGPGQLSTNWECVDILARLQRLNTWQGYVINNQALARALSDLATGFRVVVSGTPGNVSLRFDGVSKYQAFAKAVQFKGLHFRRGSEDQVQVGAFGDDSGLRIVGLDQASERLRNNPNAVLIERLDIASEGRDMFNKIVPLAGSTGSGGDVALTLKRCTLSSPYAVQSETVNGKTQYYLEDAASVATYGRIERLWSFPNIYPVAATTSGTVNAANLLYEAASKLLTRQKAPQISYKVVVRKLDKDLRPGDKVTLDYYGKVYQGDVLVDYANVRAPFWVLAVDHRYDVNGHSASLTLSNVDLPSLEAAQVLAQGISELRDGQRGASIRVNLKDYTETVSIEAGQTISLPLLLSADCVEVAKAWVTLSRTDYNGPDTLSVKVDGIPITSGLEGQPAPFLGGSGYGDSVTLSIEEALTDYITSGVNIEDPHTLEIGAVRNVGLTQLTIRYRITEVIAAVS